MRGERLQPQPGTPWLQRGKIGLRIVDPCPAQ